MEQSNRQKAKLLLLLEILRQDSDELHPLTTQELLKRLREKDISCDRRTLSRDISDLNEIGYEVMSRMCGHEKGYYVDDRTFSVPELRILMDAVQASGFITPGKSQALMEKIAALGGSYRASLMQGNTVLFNSNKHSNEFIYYTINTVEEAISRKQKVSFTYFSLDENHRKIYHAEGKRYLAEPVSLVLLRDNYYLTALTKKRKGLSIFRIDRIEDMALEAEPVSPAAEKQREVVPSIANQAFKMFLGPTETVALEFEDTLIGSVFDQFGESTRITRISPHRCKTRVRVQISGIFFGWLCQFGPLMELTGPKKVRDQLIQYISELPYPKNSDAT